MAARQIPGRRLFSAAMSQEDWKQEFREVHARGVAAWKAGRRNPSTMFSEADALFLSSSGCTEQELFDFVDDLMLSGEPDLETVCEVQALRRDYLRQIMGGRLPALVASMDDLPRKTDAVDGIAWLPRLIVKARLKLRGEMPPDLMYGCGGDRPFVRRMGSSLPAFLKLVWACGDDDRAVVESIKASARAVAGAGGH
jgi:hypothetical protein